VNISTVHKNRVVPARRRDAIAADIVIVPRLSQTGCLKYIQLVVEEFGQLKLNLRAENAFLQCPVFATAAKDKSKRRPSQIRGALFALAGISSGGFESFKFRCA
jgi:hypothetical protein